MKKQHTGDLQVLPGGKQVGTSDVELNKIFIGDSLEMLKTFPSNYVDSIVTDPPYGISFFNKKWDSFRNNAHYAAWCEKWARECLRILKPGGYMIAFSSSRTFHALAWGVEQAGFEIRDMIEWLYASGSPKGLDVSKKLDQLAGAERETVATFTTTRSANGYWAENRNSGMYKAGVQQIEITRPTTDLAVQWEGWHTNLKPAHEPAVMARKPLDVNVCHNIINHGVGAINIGKCRIGNEQVNPVSPVIGRFPSNCITLEEDQWFSKFFNITSHDLSKKASRKDRDSNWEGKIVVNNQHPTVKPVPLMAWLCRLVTPPHGIVLDPFSGSGSTLVAAKSEGFHFIGIDLDQHNVDTATLRTAA